MRRSTIVAVAALALLATVPAQGQKKMPPRRIVMRNGLLKGYDFWGVLLLVVIFAALVTPADPASTLLVAVPLFAIYLFGVVCLRLVLQGRWRIRSRGTPQDRGGPCDE